VDRTGDADRLRGFMFYDIRVKILPTQAGANVRVECADPRDEHTTRHVFGGKR